MGIFTIGKNKMAFSGEMRCPHPHPKDWTRKCDHTNFKKDEVNSTPLMIRYICKQCGKGLRYDISNNHDLTGVELAVKSRR